MWEGIEIVFVFAAEPARGYAHMPFGLWQSMISSDNYGLSTAGDERMNQNAKIRPK
jgi:hypothetical protein